MYCFAARQHPAGGDRHSEKHMADSTGTVAREVARAAGRNVSDFAANSRNPDFVDRAESVDFQKTGAFHVLVVAGLHAGALAFFLYWLARKLRLPRWAGTLRILTALFAYVLVVEQRAPVLRAGLMAGIVVAGLFFYRRLEHWSC
jgi:hypothetical protein